MNRSITNISIAGVNSRIWSALVEDEHALGVFGLYNIRQQIGQFLTEMKFKERRRLALLITKESLERHGKGQIEPFLSKLGEIETGVQQYSPNLRDHVNHSVYVYLLGLFLFTEMDSIESIDPLSWKIASLLHDIGYPLQLFSASVNEYLYFFSKQKMKMTGFDLPVSFELSLKDLEKLKFSNFNSFKTIEGKLNEWGICLDLEAIWKEGMAKGEINHGILSALITLNLVDSLYENKNPQHSRREVDRYGINWGKDCFDTQVLDAVAAISIHDLLPNIEAISLEISPIAYFLILADNLQQWNRYQPRRRIYSPSSVQIEFSNDCLMCRLHLPKRRIREIELAKSKLTSRRLNIRIVA